MKYIFLLIIMALLAGCYNKAIIICAKRTDVVVCVQKQLNREVKIVKVTELDKGVYEVLYK